MFFWENSVATPGTTAWVTVAGILVIIQILTKRSERACVNRKSKSLKRVQLRSNFQRKARLRSSATLSRLSVARGMPRQRSLQSAYRYEMGKHTPVLAQNELKSIVSRGTQADDLAPNSFENEPSASGGVDLRDWDACQRLRARLEPAENATVCTSGHSFERLSQSWRLVSKETLLRTELFQDPALVENGIPDRLYTTLNAVHYLLQAVQKERPSDDLILNALIGFSSELGSFWDERGNPLIDVEYMKPYLEPSRLHPDQKNYWSAHSKWVLGQTSKLGVITMDDGSYLTAGEEFFHKTGWEA